MQERTRDMLCHIVQTLQLSPTEAADILNATTDEIARWSVDGVPSSRSLARLVLVWNALEILEQNFVESPAKTAREPLSIFSGSTILDLLKRGERVDVALRAEFA